MATLQLRETSSNSAPPPPKRTTDGMIRARSRWRLRRVRGQEGVGWRGSGGCVGGWVSGSVEG